MDATTPRAGPVGPQAALHAFLDAAADSGGIHDDLPRLIEAARAAMGADSVHVTLGRDDPGAERADLSLELTAGRDVLGTMRVNGAGVDGDAARAVASVMSLVLVVQRQRAAERGRADDVARGRREIQAHRALAASARGGDVDEITQAVADQTLAAVGGRACAVLLGPHAASAPRVAARSGDPGPNPTWSAGFAAAASGSPQLLPGPQAAAPLTGIGGMVLGSVVVVRTSGGFSDDELRRLGDIAGQAGMALSNHRLRGELRREQRRRHAQAAAFVDAQETERRRVAEDLHDGPIQELLGLALLLDGLREGAARRMGPPSDDELASAIASMGNAADAARRAVGGIRDAVFDLHPLSLGNIGFAAAVGGVVERVGRDGPPVEVIGLDVVDALAADTRLAAFRIVQEAVANAVRHAHASAVSVEGQRTANEIVVRISDDGVGFEFDPRRPLARDAHIGLAVMHERAALAGGHLDLWTGIGLGTRVRLCFPAPGAPAG